MTWTFATSAVMLFYYSKRTRYRKTAKVLSLVFAMAAAAALWTETHR